MNWGKKNSELNYSNVFLNSIYDYFFAENNFHFVTFFLNSLLFAMYQIIYH